MIEGSILMIKVIACMIPPRSKTRVSIRKINSLALPMIDNSIIIHNNRIIFPIFCGHDGMVFVLQLHHISRSLDTSGPGFSLRNRWIILNNFCGSTVHPAPWSVTGNLGGCIGIPKCIGWTMQIII